MKFSSDNKIFRNTIMTNPTSLETLKNILEGELYTDLLHKSMYATDASVYRKIPQAVAFPKNHEDIKKLIDYSRKNNTTLIPRTAGTSLAGQCVGDGIVVDVSKYFTRILNFDEKEKTITVQPGVVRDELNLFLKPYGLFFGPNTSTSNRCMIGGMVGNNSSGSTSIKYGVTRDKVQKIKGILSDGTDVIFKDISKQEFLKIQTANTLEGKIYKVLNQELSSIDNQHEIKKEFPKPSIHRRNTGYAIDELLSFELFGGKKETLNVAKLLSGSEGTLVFSTEITLKLDVLPPSNSIVVASHFKRIDESLKATVVAMNHNLYTCELMDKVILDCTKNNREQVKNRFFIKGDPEAILMLEVKANSVEKAHQFADELITDLEKNGFGYHHPKVEGENIQKVFELRKAGLGLLGNMIGDKKAVACIEDTAVDLQDLPSYIDEFTAIMDKYKQRAVYYAHAGAGELHLRPILNLKKEEDVILFRKITTETAKLVKKYEGSFSGEHGDGIVRAEFIPLMIGEKNYQLLRRIKKVFDPNNIFNQGKITDAFPMDKNLRYQVDRTEPTIETLTDFSESEGILRLTEKCNGSGDCRKPASMGGSLCPSYRATKNERDTTRARANTLREFLTNSEKSNKFNHQELKEVFSLCLSCKACASECPSNVDVSLLKAEFLYQYQEENGYGFRNTIFAKSTKYLSFVKHFPTLINFLTNTSLSKKILGIAPQRTLPKLAKKTLRYWYNNQNLPKAKKTIYLFCDEFTNYYDVEVGKDAIYLLTKLGYEPKIISHYESGRSYISKGFLKEAQILSNKNVEIFHPLISEETPLVGIEPSAILSFRDEYLKLAKHKVKAKEIANHTYTFDEFISLEIDNGNINSSKFTDDMKEIKIHGHCHQKSLSSTHPTFKMLNIPSNYSPKILNTGCCGMAGSFGYEKENYNVSIKIGEDTLFPKIRNLSKDIEIAAAGTSCRHQILDGTKKMAKHPISILKEALL